MPLDVVYTEEPLAAAGVLLPTRLAHPNGPAANPQLTPPPQALAALGLEEMPLGSPGSRERLGYKPPWSAQGQGHH